MSWECPCGVVNHNNANVCSGCGWTVERVNIYFAENPDVFENIKKKPKYLSTAWDAFRRARGVIILYVFLFLFIKEASGFFISDSLRSQSRFLNSDVTVLGISLLLQSWLYCGILRVAIDFIRGFPCNRRKLITPLSDFSRVSVVGTVSLIPISIGFLLLIIPGIYIALTWSQVWLLLLDKRARLFDAFRLSANMTRHKKMLILSTFIVPVLYALPASIVSKILSMPKYSSAVGDGLSTVILLIAESWQIVVGAFLAFVGAVLYQDLLSSLNKAPVNEQVEYSPTVPTNLDSDAVDRK